MVVGPRGYKKVYIYVYIHVQDASIFSFLSFLPLAWERLQWVLIPHLKIQPLAICCNISSSASHGSSTHMPFLGGCNNYYGKVGALKER